MAGGPRRIGRYEVKEALGHGATGAVFAAWDPKLHREVALKVVRREVAADPKYRERFHREARAIAALRHPNIVEIYDYSGPESKILYLVMERLRGKDLFDVVSGIGQMPETVAAAIGHEICLALQCAHEAGVIHRDIKPENVFIDESGRVVLTDFGVVKAVNENSAVDGFGQKTDVIGTPGFMAPEMMTNHTLTVRTDIFAVGAMLYNVATGRLPYEGTAPMDTYRAILAGKITDPRQYNPKLSDDFCDALFKSLQAKPKKRYDTSAELREVLRRSLESNGVADVRDDMRDFMRDPVSYRIHAKQRKVSYLVERLKLAIKDRDQERADEVRQLLLSTDPKNQAVYEITGVLDVNRLAAIRGKNFPSQVAAKRAPTRRDIFTGVVVSLAILALSAASVYFRLKT